MHRNVRLRRQNQRIREHTVSIWLKQDTVSKHRRVVHQGYVYKLAGLHCTWHKL